MKMKQFQKKFSKKVLEKCCFDLHRIKTMLYDRTKKEALPKKEEQIMARNELLEDTETPELELDELDADEADLDDFGDEEVDDDLDGLSSDLDRWDTEDDLYGARADYDFIYGLLR